MQDIARLEASASLNGAAGLDACPAAVTWDTWPDSSVPGRTNLYMERWWVAHTRARNEKVVALALARQYVRHYLPLVRLHRRYATRQGTVRLPLFPGYMFLWGDYGARDKAWQTKRVANILQVEDQERLCTELRQVYRAIESGEAVDLFPSLRRGRRCLITGGALKGLTGIVIRRGRRCRMHLSVTMLGQSAVIEVDAALLEAAD